ncbi:General transcription factor 3C polypeptide 5 [Geodia barretti]|uniref:General transcription factor 3C polypeptide 5 n=1 Tax=Geodia barretti TaxID=519541 RepID=A0AA35RR97_GEOBA|nr:General transcription factor 3C polypeptide 5 [Geodia barretti]
MAEGGEGDSGLIVASVPEGQRKLMCIQYPGFVDNVDRAINSLGGMKSIEKVYYEKTHVLEARLRPEDRFCKPVVGRSLPVTNLLLALVSYYFTNGPWKMLWVRLGYDPRSTPDSKRYQCLDYRLPREIAAVSTLEARRSKLRKGLIYAGSKKQDEFQLSGDSVQLAEAVADSNAPETEACPVFIAHQLPTQRQVYYQLCDLRDESLQTLLHANDGREDECSEANGWCEEGVYDQLRKMLGEMVRRTAERVEEERDWLLQTIPAQARD